MPNKCCYIKAGGARCGAIALTDKQFCFWHSKVNRHHAEASHPKHPKRYCPQNEVRYRQEEPLTDEYFSRARVNGPTAEELPPLEDPESIQLAISMVVGSLADFRIETKRAQVMLYALQLAIFNERRMRPAAENSVQDIVTNEFGVEMAAPQLADPPAKMTAPEIADSPTEVFVSAPMESGIQLPASAPANAPDPSTNSPTYIMSPASDAGPGLVMSAAEAA